MFYLPEDLDKVAAIGEPHSAPISPVLSRVERSELSGLSTRYCLTYWMGVMPSICLKLRRQASR